MTVLNIAPSEWEQWGARLLLDDWVHRLGSHRVQIRVVEDPLRLVVSTTFGELELVPRVMGQLTPTRLARLSVAPNTILLVDSPTSAVPVTLRRRGINFLDARGDAYIQGPGVVLDLRGLGRTGVRIGAVPAARLARALTKKGTQVMFTLLSRPSLPLPNLRDLAHDSGVSLGTATHVIHELEALGHLRPGHPGLIDARVLLDAWVDAFVLKVWPDLELASMEGDPHRSYEELGADEVLLGGESATAYLGQSSLRPSTLTVYSRDLPIHAVRAGRWTKGGGRPTIFIRRRFWAFDTEPQVVVPSPLIYADLLASGDPRQIEEAEHFRRRDDTLQTLSI